MMKWIPDGSDCCKSNALLSDILFEKPKRRLFFCEGSPFLLPLFVGVLILKV